MDKEVRKPTVHSMKRRSNAHDYNRTGMYHITISVTHTLRQPLGQMAGRLDVPDDDLCAPHVELSAIGRMVEEELTVSIHRYYPMLEVLDYVIMPEHLHFLLVARRPLVSANGRSTHLGNVIAGFKLGCNRRYWALTGLTTKSPDTLQPPSPAHAASVPAHAASVPALAASAPAHAASAYSRVLGDSVAKPSSATKSHKTTNPPLFDAGYCDVMPVDEAQLATQRAYIRANPRSRMLRTANRLWLQPQRHTADTAVTIPALRGFLQRECPYQLTTDAFASVSQQLLCDNGHIVCDSYGNATLLARRLLPVVCHRKDAAIFAQQKARCLTAAAAGAVLVSARIARGEQEILDTAMLSGFPVLRIEDNGFPDLYHPSADRMDDCAAGQLLLLTPWRYQFRPHDDSVTVPFCKTMNCIAQALCRTKDDWWK